jgi:UDP-GlcNAc3NAcA epimerase
VKVVTVVGARPQFVKAAAVSRELARTAGVREIVIHTGQHFDRNMSEVFFDEMEIPLPAYSLDVNSLDHGAMTGRMLEKIEAILIKEQPDRVLVYGDTNSTLAGALAARKLHIDVIHVEAGLRSFNIEMPEELNRILTDRISTVLCCPTDNAVANLQAEGFDRFDCRVIKTGDVMQDAVLFYSKRAASCSTIIDRLGLAEAEFALCTIHRAENTNDVARLASIVSALNSISRKMRVVLPLHPRTRNFLEKSTVKLEFSTIEPVGYFDMLELLKHTQIVLTDSGGLQKEAFFFGKPCVTLRDETEWVELTACNANVLVGAEEPRIMDGFRTMLGRNIEFPKDIYGDGHAARAVREAIVGGLAGARMDALK